MTKPWERDWSQGQTGSKPWERDWSQAPAQQQPEQSGGTGQYFKETAGNFLPGAVNFGKNLVVGLPVAAARGVAQTLTHPLQTGADVASAIGRFIVSNATGAPIDADPISKAVGGYLLDRYGSLDKIKQSFHDDPFSVILDASTALTGLGGLTKNAARVGAAKATEAAAELGSVGSKLPAVNMALKTTKKAEKAANAVEFGEGPRVQKAVNAAASVTPAVKATRATKNALTAGKGLETVGNALNPLSAPVNVLKTAARVPALKDVAQAGLNALAVPGNLLSKAGNTLDDIRNNKIARTRDYLGDKITDVYNALGPRRAGGQVVDGSVNVTLPAHTAEVLKTSQMMLANPDKFLPHEVANARKFLDKYQSSTGGAGTVTGSAPARGGAQIVPGTKPNAAEAGVGASSTGLAKLQAEVNDAKNSNVKDMVNDQNKTNNKALLDHVGTFGKTPADLTAAKEARQAAFDSTYHTAKKGHAPGKHEEAIGKAGVDKRLQALMDRPAIGEAFASAEKNAPNAGKVVFEKVPVSGFSKEKGPLAGKLTGEGVHRVKLALDKMIARAKAVETDPKIATELDKYNVADLTTAKRDFLNWAEEYIPEYGEARRGFREASVPINRMEVGQHIQSELKKILENKNLDAAGRADAFDKLLSDAPKIIRNSMGESRFHSLEEVLDRSSLMKIQDVRKHLQRAKAVEADTEAGIGGKLVKDAEDSLKHIPASKQAGLASIVNQLLKLGKGKLSERDAVEIALRFKDPESARAFIKEVIDHGERRKVDATKTPLIRGTIRKYPAVVNALSPNQQERRNALAE